jgi:hypothetical protein
LKQRGFAFSPLLLEPFEVRSDGLLLSLVFTDGSAELSAWFA